MYRMECLLTLSTLIQVKKNPHPHVPHEMSVDVVHVNTGEEELPHPYVPHEMSVDVVHVNTGEEELPRPYVPHEMSVDVVHVNTGEEELIEHRSAKVFVLKFILKIIFCSDSSCPDGYFMVSAQPVMSQNSKLSKVLDTQKNILSILSRA